MVLNETYHYDFMRLTDLHRVILEKGFCAIRRKTFHQDHTDGETLSPQIVSKSIVRVIIRNKMIKYGRPLAPK